MISPLASYLREQAEWRRDVDDRFPGDRRNALWANRLDVLADACDGLDPANIYLRRIHAVHDDYGTGIFRGNGLTALRRFSKPKTDDIDRWLPAFAEQYVTEAIADYFDDHPESAVHELCFDGDPEIALAAIRTVRSILDRLEGDARDRSER